MRIWASIGIMLRHSKATAFFINYRVAIASTLLSLGVSDSIAFSKAETNAQVSSPRGWNPEPYLLLNSQTSLPKPHERCG